tara:strand:+ start:2693 stop:2812 length:120 start_codon:yes stop_codon:yes gene_type:complete
MNLENAIAIILGLLVFAAIHHLSGVDCSNDATENKEINR